MSSARSIVPGHRQTMGKYDPPAVRESATSGKLIRKPLYRLEWRQVVAASEHLFCAAFESGARCEIQNEAADVADEAFFGEFRILLRDGLESHSLYTSAFQISRWRETPLPAPTATHWETEQRDWQCRLEHGEAVRTALRNAVAGNAIAGDAGAALMAAFERAHRAHWPIPGLN
jgi:hypothetical protein